ncbi:MAG TPA: amidohydrolase family protein [Phycisphaerae bacterium]|nr:amidohydrolase family protein [Phycisphaerae bacterium]
MNMPSTPSHRTLRGVFLLLAAIGLIGCRQHDRRPEDQGNRTDERQAIHQTLPDAQAGVLSRLMPDPRIVNTHEHLRGGANPLAKMAEADRRAGVAATALVASPRWTFTLQKGTGFEEHHENNEYLCRLARENPGRYYAFVTFDPDEEGITRKLEDYVAQGATGVKLYAGHGAVTGDGRPFHVCPLDDPKLLPLYEYCEVHRIPVCLHVNMRKFPDEARRVFERYPDLPIIVPHFGLWSGLLSKLDELLTEYPNLLTDQSFGWWYSLDGLGRYDKNPDAFRDFIIKYQDRVLFGTDVVITEFAGKSAEALTDFWLSYRASLELDRYDFTDRDGKVHHFKGLALPQDVLRKIYHENWERLLKRCGRFVPMDPSQPLAVTGG